jgi:hypothetical protein
MGNKLPGCSETSVTTTNIRCINIPEEGRSQSYRCGRLKSREEISWYPNLIPMTVFLNPIYPLIQYLRHYVISTVLSRNKIRSLLLNSLFTCTNVGELPHVKPHDVFKSNKPVGHKAFDKQETTLLQEISSLKSETVSMRPVRAAVTLQRGTQLHYLKTLSVNKIISSTADT